MKIVWTPEEQALRKEMRRQGRGPRLVTGFVIAAWVFLALAAITYPSVTSLIAAAIATPAVYFWVWGDFGFEWRR